MSYIGQNEPELLYVPSTLRNFQASPTKRSLMGLSKTYAISMNIAPFYGTVFSLMVATSLPFCHYRKTCPTEPLINQEPVKIRHFLKSLPISFNKFGTCINQTSTLTKKRDSLTGFTISIFNDKKVKFDITSITQMSMNMILLFYIYETRYS